MMKFELPKLEYSFDALEPFIDAKTMEIHYSKHHQAYLDKFNAVLAKYPDLNYESAEAILKDLTNLPVGEEDKKIIKNFGGGYVNHSLYWKIMAPKKEIDQKLIADIETDFGGVENFKAEFSKISTAHFGSGWAWLVRSGDNKLKIYSLPNQDSPLSLGDEPIATIDLWEHAYYLKYQNRRAEYIENWWNVLKLM
ncbi:MAG: superoxide dismutase [Patescibacteria group bacterium]